jgi:hypothetical protein
MKIPVVTIIALTTLLCLQSLGFAQGTPKVQWIKPFAGQLNGNHESCLVTVDKEGNAYVAGKYDVAGTLGDQFDFVTIKYNKAGAEQWVATYGGSGIDEPMAIAADDAGNVYVHGRSMVSNYDYTTLKYNSSGVQQWVKKYDGPSHSGDLGSGMVLDAAGNIYVTGWSKGDVYPVVGSDFDFVTIKYNSVGEQQWLARYDGSQRTGSVWIISNDYGKFIAVDNSGNVYVTGTGGNNIYTVKYDAQGVQQWVKSYSGPGVSDDSPAGIAVDAGGNVYVAGTTQGYGAGYDIVAIKYNASGVEQWTSRYSSANDDYAADMLLDGLGNLYVCGSSKGSALTAKFTTSGTLAWSVLYDPAATYGTDATAMAMDLQGNIYVTGSSQMQKSGYDYVTLKYTGDGQQQWVVQYDNNNGFDLCKDIAVDREGGVIVTGYQVTSGANTITTVKYSQTATAVENERTNAPTSFRLSQNYPNPFNPSTTIDYYIPSAATVSLEIFNTLGEQVTVLVDGHKEAGNYQITWSATTPSGLYFYRLQARPTEGRQAGNASTGSVRGFVETKKMILLR